MVMPQTYMRTLPGSMGTKASFFPVRLLWILRVSMLVLPVIGRVTW